MDGRTKTVVASLGVVVFMGAMGFGIAGVAVLLTLGF